MYSVEVIGNGRPHIVKEHVFQRNRSVLSAEDPALKLLELRSYVPLAAGQGLLADICIGNEILVEIGDLDKVPVNLVISYPKLRDTGLFFLLRFYLSEDILGVVHVVADEIKLLVVAFLYHSAFSD